MLSQGPRVAVSGSRKDSPQGLARARELVAHLCERGIVAVSCLAEGIDTAAPQAILGAGGRTIVMGVDVCNPHVLSTTLDSLSPVPVLMIVVGLLRGTL
jgi:DNA processing protein